MTPARRDTSALRDLAPCGGYLRHKLNSEKGVCFFRGDRFAKTRGISVVSEQVLRLSSHST